MRIAIAIQFFYSPFFCLHSLNVHTFLIATFVCYFLGDLSAKSKAVIAGAAGGGAPLLVIIVVIIIFIVFRFRRCVNYTDPYFFVLALILIPSQFCFSLSSSAVGHFSSLHFCLN